MSENEFTDSDQPVCDEEGFVLDEYGQPWGHCNSCGDEMPAYSECCDDGEVVPELG